jgi:hypothetical protein
MSVSGARIVGGSMSEARSRLDAAIVKIGHIAGDLSPPGK